MRFYSSIQRRLPVLIALLLVTGITTNAQQPTAAKPVWWFGGSAAANFNFYRGTTQVLNSAVTTPTAFHKGNGIRPYFSLLTEYRPNNKWGGMLNIAYDNRGGKFDEVMAPCDCPANLSTNISYLAIEPSLRFAPFSSGFYVFAGPTISFNMAKEFKYTQDKQTDKEGDWSEIRKTAFSAQAGAGIDLPLSTSKNGTQVTLSPFAAFLTDIGHQPRAIESWSFYTVRAGIAIKFGRARKSAPVAIIQPPVSVPKPVGKEVEFSVRAPKAVPSNRNVKETFPFRNSVFFDLGSTSIPNRYVQLSSAQAMQFKEEQLQVSQPDNLTTGRSARQLAVYHNILNVIGDRMREHPASSITLTGASDNNAAGGKLMAESIKLYLVDVFGITPSRIITIGREKPILPSEQPGATKELVLLREGDRRVDIESTSPELLLQVGGTSAEFLKPVQITAIQTDPMDSHVVFNAVGANEVLRTWTVSLTDEQGKVQVYGPYLKDQASVSGKTILGDNTQGNYKVVMTGATLDGKAVRKESSVSLVKTDEVQQEGLRYSILFDFDNSKTIAKYEKFLADVVTPLIPENGTVIIHGHTDVIGEDTHNHTLSLERATGVKQIIEKALLNRKTRGVKFEILGFGEDPATSPFENNLPEERFYNRTVIIDIIPGK